MIKKISCRVIRSVTADKSNGKQRVGKFDDKRSRAGDIIAGDNVSRSSGSCVVSVKSHRLAVGFLNYTRRSDIKVAFDGSAGRVLDFYA